MRALERLAAAISEVSPARQGVRDALWQGRPIGRIAVAIFPSEERHARAAAELHDLEIELPAAAPAGMAEKWREALLWDLQTLLAKAQLPGDGLLALGVPRIVGGQSQGICEIFGARVEQQPDGYFYVHPLPADPELIDAIELRPWEETRYWEGVEYLRYARAVSEGRFPLRGGMTGPLDTANYLLGTMTLLEWLLTRPEVIHRLLDKIADLEIRLIRGFREAAGGALLPPSVCCTGGGHEFASECRSLISRELYEEFEAPRLRRMGEALGPYAIHACGSWERTIPSALGDPNLRAINGQSKENDVPTLCELADGRLTLSIGRSENLADKYLWPDMESFLAHLLEVVPPTQPFEIQLMEPDLPLWNRLCRERGREAGRIGE